MGNFLGNNSTNTEPTPSTISSYSQINSALAANTPVVIANVPVKVKVDRGALEAAEQANKKETRLHQQKLLKSQFNRTEQKHQPNAKMPNKQPGGRQMCR